LNVEVKRKYLYTNKYNWKNNLKIQLNALWIWFFLTWYIFKFFSWDYKHNAKNHQLKAVQSKKTLYENSIFFNMGNVVHRDKNTVFHVERYL